MTDLRLDPSTNDLLLEDFNFSLTDEDDESVAQRLNIRLKFFKGEWFLNENFGVPYYQDILKKQKDTSIVDVIFRRHILITPGIEALLNYESEFNLADREFSIAFKARSKTGEELSLDFLGDL